MAITILDAAKARGVKSVDGAIELEEFHRVGLPFFAGCEICEAQLGPGNAYPSKSGYIRCGDCLGVLGFETVEEFEKGVEDEVAIAEAENEGV